MTIVQRSYTETPGITEDYRKVRDFLLTLPVAEFTYARWDWMITHSMLDHEAVRRIGVWEEDSLVVGLATFDTRIGTAYCLTLPEYTRLKSEMLDYAAAHLSDGDSCRIVISDRDDFFQKVAADSGFVATTAKESDAAFYPDQTSMAYTLPPDFRIVSMKDIYDPYQYRQVLWKGFNHELNGEGSLVFGKEEQDQVDVEMLRPNVDLDWKVAVMSDQGEFVSYCGMWFDPRAGFAVVEPVATVPDYRRRGFGRAVVLEGIQRVARLGARKVLVGSSQQFYYSIGFRPYATATVWTRPK